MSLKRSHTSSKSAFGGGDAGAKVDRQELYDELKRMAANNESFTPVDIALSIGAGEPQVSKALLGLAAEGYLEKVETGKYKAAGMAELGQAEFLKAFARASRVDSTRQRDLAEICAPQTEQRHHEAASAHGDRRARSLPGGAQAARHRSPARSRAPAPEAPAARAAAPPPTRRARPHLPTRARRRRPRRAAGSRGPVARVGRCAVGTGRHRRARQQLARRAEPARASRKREPPCASR